MRSRQTESSSESLTIQNSWLETSNPNEIENRRTESRNSESNSVATPLNGSLNEDIAPSPSVEIQASSSASNFSSIQEAHSVFPQSQFQHPGIHCLLQEYYKLLESNKDSKLATVRSNCYRPSVARRMWNALMIELPPALQFGNVLRLIRTLIVKRVPLSPLGIIALLLLWLTVIGTLIEMPFVCLIVGIMGIYSLTLSEEKLKEATELKRNPKDTLKSFEIANNVRGVPLVAKQYIKIKQRGRLEPNPLSSIEWPRLLPKPINAEKEKLELIERDINLLRIAVMGPDNNRSFSSNRESNLESAISSIQELCSLVGVERMPLTIKSWEAIQSKIKELQDELGL